MISKKASVSIVQVILVIGICVFVGLLFVSELIVPAWGEGCKETQIAELDNKIWRELDYWEAKNKTQPAVGYNIVPDVHIKPCVKEIKYDDSTGNLTIIYTDDGKDEMSAKGEWKMKNPEPPPEFIDIRLTLETCPDETCNFKVSLRRVELME